MKYLILFFVIMSKCLSIAGANGSGGANSLGGKMIESYIKEPNKLRGYSMFYVQLNILKNKSPDLYAVLSEGLSNSTWYFIPGSLKELSINVTGIPFGSDQTAIQVFKTREIWVDQNKYDSLESDNERATAIAHEALLAGLNSFLKKRHKEVILGAGVVNEPYSDEYFVFRTGETMPDIKSIIRPTASMIMSPNLTEMKPSELLSNLERFGWNLKNERQVVCTQGRPLYRPDIFSFLLAGSKKVFSCTEMLPYK